VFSKSETLENLGLDVPQVTELAHELRKSGIELPADILSEKECVEELIKILK